MPVLTVDELSPRSKRRAQLCQRYGEPSLALWLGEQNLVDAAQARCVPARRLSPLNEAEKAEELKQHV